jgi:glycogenin glucosyltransferase
MTLSSASPRTAADHAFVTLITSDSYLPGALAQSAALNDLHPTRRGGKFGCLTHASCMYLYYFLGQFPSSINLEEESDPVPFTTVCLVTPETVSVGTIKQLRRTFDLVIGVEVIEGDKNAEEIKLLGTQVSHLFPSTTCIFPLSRTLLGYSLDSWMFLLPCGCLLNYPGRPDLHQTFTKLHILRLAQFASLVYLDADVLPLRPISHLLNMVSSWPDEYFQADGGDKTPTATAPGDVSLLTASTVTKRNPHRLNNPAYPCPVSAAPDSGWPDIFNSGVIVLAPPGERGFKEAMAVRSWDGGDQGTLNEWTGNQAGLVSGQGSGGPGWNRLSFKYNVTPTAAYMYVLIVYIEREWYSYTFLGTPQLTRNLVPAYMLYILSVEQNLGVAYPSDPLSFRVADARSRNMTLALMVRRLETQPRCPENPPTPIILW